MSLESLCREIAATSDARAVALLRNAQAESSRMAQEAQSQAERAVRAARADGEAFAAAETAERRNAAALESSKLLSEAREEAVRQAVAQVWAQYRQMPRRPGYAKKVRRLAEQAVQELDISGALLRARSEDLPLLAEAGFRVNREPLDCAGGVRAESRDGRILVDYTLEAQFDAKREEVAREAFARLFSDAEEPTVLMCAPSRARRNVATRASPKTPRAKAAKSPSLLRTRKKRKGKSKPAKRGRR